MRVLLVEPDYRKGTPKVNDCGKVNDETLWYPSLGLMKLARFHKDRGDEVTFVRGCCTDLNPKAALFTDGVVYDRVYITTLFTFDFDKVVKTINFYK